MCSIFVRKKENLEMTLQNLFPLLLLFFVGFVRPQCLQYQVPHTVDARTICCQPVFNCPLDHEIVYCSEDGEKDICIPCKGGAVNKFNTSSLDKEHHVCFIKTESHKQCPIQDTSPILEPKSCPDLPCKCRTEECRFGNVCKSCDQKNSPCGVNEEMNESGDCVPCKDLMTSPVGCAPCQYNETLWRLHQDKFGNVDEGSVTSGGSASHKVTNKVEKTMSVTVEKGGAVEGGKGYNIATDASSKNVTGTEEQGKTEEGDNSFIIIVVVVIAVLLFFGLAVAFALYIKNVDDNSRFAVWKHKFCNRNRNNYRNGQQGAEEAGTNGDVRHHEETEFTQPTAAIKPMLRQTDEVTDNGACGGDEGGVCGGDDAPNGPNMALLKGNDEETREKEK